MFQQCFLNSYPLSSYDYDLGSNNQVSIHKDTWPKPYSIAVQDTTGFEKHEILRRLCYPGTNLFIVAFSADSSKLEEQYEVAESEWLPEIVDNCPDASVILLGVHDAHTTDSQTPMGQDFRNRIVNTERGHSIRIQPAQCYLDVLSSINAVFAKVSRLYWISKCR